MQLVRLIQAESEAIALVESPSDKRPRTAAVSPKEAPPAKVPPPNPSAPSPTVSAVQPSVGDAKGKDKGKGKGKGSKGSEGSERVCHKFAEASGCKFGDACMFRHDRAAARRENRCLACGQAGHFRPDCPLVAPENRAVVSEGSPGGSPKSGQAQRGPKGKAK